DKYREPILATQFIQLTSPSTNELINEAITINGKKDTYQTGEIINYTVNTGFDNVWMIHTMSSMDQKPGISFHLFEKNKPMQFSYDVTEARRGSIKVNYAFVKHNRIYITDENFDIPWSNKELNISYATFRDKLLPGSNETFSVKITGNKGEKVAAEMLAAMYDASLDEFNHHNWGKLNIWPTLYNYDYNWQGNGFEKVESQEYNTEGNNENEIFDISYDKLGIKNYKGNIFYDWGDIGGVRNIRKYKLTSVQNYDFAAPAAALQGKVAGIQIRGNSSEAIDILKSDKQEDGRLKYLGNMLWATADTVKFNMSTSNVPYLKIEETTPVQVRTNFNETACFFPNLETDTAGNISFSVTMPEALTKWKLMTLAHTKEVASGYSEKLILTQKPLMVQPNPPRFLREGDAIEFSAKIVNMGDSEITGTVQLELMDATNNKSIDGWFKNIFPNQYFTIGAGQSSIIKFPIEIPFNFNSAMTYRIIAKTNTLSDGEEMAIPVLSNRTLVTESIPLNLRNQSSKQFKFEKLLSSGNSNSITHHALTVEYTSNPAWYAVQALPYLMEYPYECAEQTFNRYYANMLAAYISNASPKIKAVFEKWKNLDTTALLSNLQKNQELKSALLQETPWVLDAQNENQQKKNIALLFDLEKMSSETTKAFTILKDMQSSNGGFVWFKGGPDDRYITQYIITGIGHLKKLNAISNENYQKIKLIVDNAIMYLDKKIKEDYDNLSSHKALLKLDQLDNLQIQYLYMRSFFPEYKIAEASVTAFNYYREQSQKYWLSKSKYMQAMIALSLYRTKDVEFPKAIIKSFKETAISKEELGMYWKEYNNGGYYWQQAPIESQAMMIEAFTDIDKNNGTVDDLKTWLLKQKQTQNWKTTKATAEACYALLLNGNNWINEEKEVTVNLGNAIIKSTDDATEAGSGYFKKRIEGAKVNPGMGNITVTLNSSTSKLLNPSTPKPLNPTTTSWGAVYWQYFDDLDKVTSSETPLQLKKQMFVERNTDNGAVLEALEDGAQLKVGDKVKVRIQLKVDRDMEYVHMKDLRAACMEPVNVLSEYKYQGGLGYYECTKDASTNFFFSNINRGTYIFEYPLFVTHAGNFSNGIASIQCMYAPEFTAHSEGIKVSVE
ncbi:MAG: alpha-2-macroglobulin family protein, partial [Ferruginibacter sp.]